MTLLSPIVQADLYAVSLPYIKAVEWTTGGVETHAHYVVARIMDDEGRIGAAEVPCRAAWNGMCSAGMIQLFSDIVWPMLSSVSSKPIARSVRDVGALTVLLDNLVSDLEYGQKPITPPISSAPAVYVITRGTPAEMALTAKDAVARGFGAVKVKLGQGLETDRTVLDLIRRAVGDDFPLCADANGAYAGAEVHQLLDLAQSYRLTFLEDPCDLPPLRARLANLPQSLMQIVVDRYCTNNLAAQQYADLGFTHFAAKPTRVGFTEANKIIETASVSGGKAIIGLFGESAAGALTQLRLASTNHSEFLGVEASFHEALKDNYLKFPIEIKGGHYLATPTLHLASAIDWNKLETLANSSQNLRI